MNAVRDDREAIRILYGFRKDSGGLEKSACVTYARQRESEAIMP